MLCGGNQGEKRRCGWQVKTPNATIKKKKKKKIRLPQQNLAHAHTSFSYVAKALTVSSQAAITIVCGFLSFSFFFFRLLTIAALLLSVSGFAAKKKKETPLAPTVC